MLDEDDDAVCSLQPGIGHSSTLVGLQVQRDIGFKHIRGHGLLDDDVSTYLGGNGAAGTNLINLFSVFGAVLLPSRGYSVVNSAFNLDSFHSSACSRLLPQRWNSPHL